MICRQDFLAGGDHFLQQALRVVEFSLSTHDWDGISRVANAILGKWFSSAKPNEQIRLYLGLGLGLGVRGHLSRLVEISKSTDPRCFIRGIFEQHLPYMVPVGRIPWLGH